MGTLYKVKYLSVLAWQTAFSSWVAVAGFGIILGWRIGYVGFPADRVHGHDHLQGFKDGIKAAGLPINAEWVTEGDLQVEGGYSCGERLLSLAERPSAIVVANDMMAVGSMLAARQGGLHIPGDLAVIGFDDVPVAQLVDPPLTTVAQPIEEMGAEAVNLILRKIAQPGCRNRHLVLKPELRIRGSA